MFPKTRFNQSTTAPRSFHTLNKRTLTRRYHLPSILQTILEIITFSIDAHLQNTTYTTTNPPVVSPTKTAGYHRSIMQHSLVNVCKMSMNPCNASAQINRCISFHLSH